MAQVKFKKGLLKDLQNCPVEEGQFLVVTDNRSIYVDVAAGTRIRIGDYQIVASQGELPESGADSELYYIEDDNILTRWDKDYQGSGGWVQINPDTGATGIEFTGAGSASFGGTYDSEGRKLTVTVANELATTESVTEQISGLDSKFAAKEHTHTSDQIDDFEEKMAEKAGEQEFQRLSTKVDGIEKKIGGLSGAMHFQGVVKEDPTHMEDVSKYNEGDVVAWQNAEYVFEKESIKDETGKFVELGDNTALSGRVTEIETWKTTAEKTLGDLDTTYAKISQVSTDIQEAKIELIGEDEAQPEDTTIKGAKAYTDDAITNLNIEQYAKTSALADYVQTSTLEDYATVASLSEYAKSKDLANYATVASLGDYVKTETLDAYATDTEVSEAITTALSWQDF